MAKLELNDYTGAFKDFNNAIQLKPDFALAYYDRGFAKYYLEDHKGAIEDLEKAKDLFSDQNNMTMYKVTLEIL